MSRRTRCMCSCECEFLADLPPRYGGVRPLVSYRCPECEEAFSRKETPHHDDRVRIHFYNPYYSRTTT